MWLENIRFPHVFQNGYKVNWLYLTGAVQNQNLPTAGLDWTGGFPGPQIGLLYFTITYWGWTVPPGFCFIVWFNISCWCISQYENSHLDAVQLHLSSPAQWCTEAEAGVRAHEVSMNTVVQLTVVLASACIKPLSPVGCHWLARPTGMTSKGQAKDYSTQGRRSAGDGVHRPILKLIS